MRRSGRSIVGFEVACRDQLRVLLATGWLNGNWQFGDLGEGEFTGRRDKAEVVCYGGMVNECICNHDGDSIRLSTRSMVVVVSLCLLLSLSEV